MLKFLATGLFLVLCGGLVVMSIVGALPQGCLSELRVPPLEFDPLLGSCWRSSDRR